MSSAGELFDLCDERGRPTGQTKPRALVHRDGDWHRSFHCWVVSLSADRQPLVLLQLRAPTKDTWPGLWDVSVAGHYSAGEGMEGGIREIREELGLEVAPEDLVQVGWRREEVFYEDGLIEREVQDIVFLRRDIDPLALQPNVDEVSAVALVSAASLPLLAHGRIASVTAAGGYVQLDGTVQPSAARVSASDLVPRAGQYYDKVARFARLLALGRASVRRRRWW